MRMNEFMAKQKGKANKDRPGSEALRDLHIYLVPREKWLERRQIAENQVVKHTISLGFVRVIPEITLTDLRHEVSQQLRDDLIPENFVFLRKVGRDYTQVKPNQELQMKVKYYFPPTIVQPEIFVLEGSYISRLNSSIENSDAEDVQGKVMKGKKHMNLNASKNFRSNRRLLSEKNNLPKNFPNQREKKKNVNSEVIGRNSIVTETKVSKKSKIDAVDDDKIDAVDDDKSNHEQVEESGEMVDTAAAAESWIDASSNHDQKSGKVPKKAKHNGVKSNIRGFDSKSKNVFSRGTKARPKLPIHSRYKTVRGPNKSRDNSITKKIVQDPNDINAEEEITVEEKIEMLTTNQSDEDIPKEIQENTEEVMGHVVVDESEHDSASRVDSSKLKIDVNAELIDGDNFEGNEVRLSLENDESEDSNEIEELLLVLKKVQEERFELENRRREMIAHVKTFQETAHERKRQLKEEWKNRYLEAKRITPHLEDTCAKLKLELEKIHRNFLSEHESRQKKRRNTNGKSGDKPSQKTTYKITISKLNNEIDDLSRKVETAKVRLSAEMKLRAQAEKEVKTLRRDLTEKKIHVTLTRSHKFNTFGGRQPKDLNI